VAASKFTDENQAALLERFAAGATVDEAARGCGIRPKTVSGWLTRGRRGGDENDRYVSFAAAASKARADARAAAASAMTPEEFDEHLAKAVRAGSVSAMKLFYEIQRDRRGEDPPGDEFEDL
jgi:DNA-binding CsgD family transcriptional regulator